MYRCCYAGHLNLMPPSGPGNLAATPNLAVVGTDIGSRGGLLVAPSDDGSVFVWDYATGRLLNVLEGSPGSTACCVAWHPTLPALASGGADAVVRLWSPEAAAACDMQQAAAVVQANAEALLAADVQPQVAPPPGLQLAEQLAGGGANCAFM